MGSKLSCYSSSKSVKKTDPPKWLTTISDIIEVLLKRQMTREAYLLQESLFVTQNLTISKEEKELFINTIVETFKIVSKYIVSSTRWMFRINNYDQNVFEALTSLSNDQYISVTIYKEYYPMSDTKYAMSMYGYFISKQETTRAQMTELLGEDCFVFAPSFSSVKIYDEFLLENGEVHSFGNNETKKATFV